jgi:dTDP-glucose 4,6-dehydratase
MSKHLLVTGGAGFIGSNFIHYLHEKYPDYRFTVLDALTYAASMDNLPQAEMRRPDGRIRFWYGNVTNAELVDTLVAESDIVVHFAAETHVTRSIFDNLLFFQTDVIGTHTVANAVLKARDRVERFIHVSTSEVYGSALAPKMDEEHPYNPMSPYASAKCGADRLVHSYYATYKIPAIIVRPFNNYGPRQHLEKVVPRFVTSVLLDEPLTVHGDGTAARDFVYVADCCRAIDLLIHAPLEKVAGDVFNIASGQDRTILSIANDIVRLMKADPKIITFSSNRPGQVVRHTGDAAKVHAAVGWQPQSDWEDGLRRTIAWFEQNRACWEKQVWARQIMIRTSTGDIVFH